jgi:hypothetical protein
MMLHSIFYSWDSRQWVSMDRSLQW